MNVPLPHLPGGEQAHALSFPPAKMGTTAGRGIIVEPPSRAKGMGTDLLGAKQSLERQLQAGTDREGT